MTAVDEVELDGLLLHLVGEAILILIAVVIGNLYVAIVLDPAAESTLDNCRALWVSDFDQTIPGYVVQKILFKMGRTAPADRHVRWIR